MTDCANEVVFKFHALESAKQFLRNFWTHSAEPGVTYQCVLSRTGDTFEVTISWNDPAHNKPIPSRYFDGFITEIRYTGPDGVMRKYECE